MWQQQDKETLFKRIQRQKPAAAKGTYRFAKIYLEKFGKDADQKTKYGAPTSVILSSCADIFSPRIKQRPTSTHPKANAN
jgi:hypothetical protein